MCRRFVVVLARSAAFVLFSGIYVRFFSVSVFFIPREKNCKKINFYKSNACTCLFILRNFYANFIFYI